ncbi:MAG TPA: diaminopimelate decarboxylase [Candidatus Latescibacteria bacterium]|nr:diaminopimelate decarboxylase [Candidatus Latescibacterota bacterium]HQE62770.1 diaminopimelate decarboxylase [Candidatus Latescibacterota bacterium]
MHYFAYANEVLRGEEVDLRDIAESVGTPCYVYSHRTLLQHAHVLDAAWGEREHLTCYSVKACSNIAILRLFAQMGLGADIVSGGELYRALLAGFPPDKIVYSGVGKTTEEMREALRAGIFCFNVESEAELVELNRVAQREYRRARISLRINPEIDPKTHPKTATGLKTAKFGVPHSRAVETYRRASELEWLEVIGIDAHIGSPIMSVQPFVDAAKRLVDLVGHIRAEGIELKWIDIGGGLGITYDVEDPPTPKEWAAAVGDVLNDAGLGIITEPGRSIVGNAAVLLTKVLYLKRNEDKNFVVVDAAMNDLIRPSFYDSFHRIQPVVQRGTEPFVADVVGPVCESGDFLARNRSIARPEQGDILAVMSAGAYGFAMSSQYNSRRRAAEVMVKGGTWQVIRDRETCEDLVRGERFFTL